jgi:hypothetical protein
VGKTTLGYACLGIAENVEWFAFGTALKVSGG